MRGQSPSPLKLAVERAARPLRKALVVADVVKEVRVIAEGIEAHGYAVVHEASGEGAFFRAVTERFDVILLDLMAPERSSVEVIAAIRAQGVKTPVLVLTPQEAIQDRVAVLEAGANGCLVKPFAIADFLARMQAPQVRRLQPTRHRK